MTLPSIPRVRARENFNFIYFTLSVRSRNRINILNLSLSNKIFTMEINDEQSDAGNCLTTKSRKHNIKF